MTKEERDEIVSEIVAGVSNAPQRPCNFDLRERKKLHEFLDAIDAEGADHETHVYVFRIGNNFKNAIKKSGQYVTWVFLLAIVIVMAHAMNITINPLKWFR